MRSAQLAVLAALTSGCSAFHDSSTSTSLQTWGFEETTFDERLPDAMEHLFWDCTEPLVLTDGQEEVDLLGNCQSWYYDAGTPENTLAMLLTMQDVTLSEPLALSSAGEPTTIGFQLWGRYACSTEVTPTVEVQEVELYDLQSWWTTRNGDAALRVDFDFDAGVEAEVSFSRGPVTCGYTWMNRYAIDPVLNSSFQFELSQPDLDIWFVLSETNSHQLQVEVEAEMDIGEILVGNALDLLPTDFKEDLLASQGFSVSEHEDNISMGIEDAFAGVAEAVERAVDDELEAICSVTVSSGELVLMSDDDCSTTTDARTTTYWGR